MKCRSVAALLVVITMEMMVEGITNSNEKVISEFLLPQNEARKAVEVPPLRWNATLTTYARNYGRERRGDCVLRHSEGPYGENIFWGSGRQWKAGQAVQAWVGEREWYVYGNNTCMGSDCGHYTQIVWRTTTCVGCALVRCHSGDTFIICSYYPPGNYVGAIPY